MAEVKKSAFIEQFCTEMEDEGVAIFAGAGLSVPAGFVDWKDLLRPLAEELDLSVDRESDMVRLAQYHINHHNNSRSDLNNAIINTFAKDKAKITENHSILSRLPINTYWTTNYDSCIEDALRQVKKVADVKHEPKQLRQTLRGRDAVVYKMHGDWQHSADAVIAKNDFERYHLDHADFITTLSGDLLSKTFLFIGLSFSDPNLDYVLSRVHARDPGNSQRKHFCFVKREQAKAGDQPGDLAYRQALQAHFIKDLGRYNIRAVVVDEYHEVTEVLREIERRHKSHTVFVSGAAEDYAPHEPAAALDFVRRLSKQMISKHLRVISGLGIGIGLAVVEGALLEIYKTQHTKLSDQIIMRPFPQGPEGKEVWTQYRHDMLSFAGMSIFMFGNKGVSGKEGVQPSNGMYEEFEIALQHGAKVLPLGFTGSVAKELYDKVAADMDRFYPDASKDFTDLFAQLGDPSRTLDDQVTAVLAALELLAKMTRGLSS